MLLKRTKEFLEKICNMEMPLSNTVRGEQIHQTHRNKLTAELKEALYEDCKECFPIDNTAGILPYITKDGVIFELPNISVADNTPNDYTGAISIECKFTFKGLEFSAPEAEEEYRFTQKQAIEKKKKAELEKAISIKKQQEAKKARELKRAKLMEIVLSEDTN